MLYNHAVGLNVHHGSLPAKRSNTEVRFWFSFRWPRPARVAVAAQETLVIHRELNHDVDSTVSRQRAPHRSKWLLSLHVHT